MKTPNELRTEIQTLLKEAGYYKGKIDADFGVKTYDAIRALDLDVDETVPADEWPSETVNRVKASSFADPADIAGFKRCKARGGSDQLCFKSGDDGRGFGGLTDCTDETIPYVALPHNQWLTRWGGVKEALKKPVLVTINGQTVRCLLGDTMPYTKNITNGCGIDLAVGAQKAFGLKAPFLVTASWQWEADKDKPSDIT